MLDAPLCTCLAPKARFHPSLGHRPRILIAWWTSAESAIQRPETSPNELRFQRWLSGIVRIPGALPQAVDELRRWR